MCRKIRGEGDVAYVPLTKGHEAVIDAADLHLVEGKNWQAFETKKHVYATHSFVADGKRQCVFMHRLIMSPEESMLVDHRDGSGLNNRRSNLRTATLKQNSRNRQMHRSNTSGFKGVCWNKKREKWQAQIRVNRKLKYLGLFDEIQDAGRAYNNAAVEHFGAFARLNELESVNV